MIDKVIINEMHGSTNERLKQAAILTKVSLASLLSSAPMTRVFEAPNQ